MQTEGGEVKKWLCLAMVAAMAALGAGCAKAVHKDGMAVNGSRSDATIMVYVWNPRTEKPVTSEQQALDLASAKCRTWGYKRAEPFDSLIARCTNQAFQPFVGIVCQQMQMEETFQCVGTLPPEIENVSGQKNPVNIRLPLTEEPSHQFTCRKPLFCPAALRGKA